MAAVHIGRLLGPVGFAKTVAIKRLHAHLARNPEFVAMFLDEARLAARIRHPNVVSTLDVVAIEGELFVVMEYVPGDSLARLLQGARERGEGVPLPVAASIMVGVLHGLHAAHEASDEKGKPLGLVHRDVSPHNVLVGTDGAAHLIDFGIAKAAGRVQVTREGQLKGKLAYMAPEQLRGGRVDRRADVFGACVVFWEMLTGRRLFDGADEGEIYGQVLRADVPKPSKIAGGDRAKVTDAIVLRGLTRSPEKRYPTARAAALAIEESLPLAPPSQVGQWVERVGEPELAERARRIAEVEGMAGHGTSAPLLPRPRDNAAMATAPGRKDGHRRVLPRGDASHHTPAGAGGRPYRHVSRLVGARARCAKVSPRVRRGHRRGRGPRSPRGRGNREPRSFGAGRRAFGGAVVRHGHHVSSNRESTHIVAAIGRAARRRDRSQRPATCSVSPTSRARARHHAPSAQPGVRSSVHRRRERLPEV